MREKTKMDIEWKVRFEDVQKKIKLISRENKRLYKENIELKKKLNLVFYFRHDKKLIY